MKKTVFYAIYTVRLKKNRTPCMNPLYYGLTKEMYFMLIAILYLFLFLMKVLNGQNIKLKLQ